MKQQKKNTVLIEQDFTNRKMTIMYHKYQILIQFQMQTSLDFIFFKMMTHIFIYVIHTYYV